MSAWNHSRHKAFPYLATSHLHLGVGATNVIGRISMNADGLIADRRENRCLLVAIAMRSRKNILLDYVNTSDVNRVCTSDRITLLASH